MIELPRYLPVTDPKDPPRFLVFCDVFQDKLDPYRGVPVKSAAVVDYLKGAMALDRTGPAPRPCSTSARFLEHADKEIARDAFLEFAKASDQDIGQVGEQAVAGQAARMAARTRRRRASARRCMRSCWAACGGEQDAALLQSLLQNPNDRPCRRSTASWPATCSCARRRDGTWCWAILRDEKQPFQLRFAVLRTLRFQHGWQAGRECATRS